MKIRCVLIVCTQRKLSSNRAIRRGLKKLQKCTRKHRTISAYIFHHKWKIRFRFEDKNLLDSFSQPSLFIAAFILFYKLRLLKGRQEKIFETSDYLEILCLCLKDVEMSNVLWLWGEHKDYFVFFSKLCKFSLKISVFCDNGFRWLCQHSETTYRASKEKDS